MREGNQAATPEQLHIIGAMAAELITTGQAVGLGSGRAAHAFVRRLGERIAKTGLKIVGIPTSEATARLARQCGIPLGSLLDISQLDIAVDGADEVDPEFNLSKGGGGDLLREKVIASIAVRYVVVVGEEKLVEHLGMRFPVFVEVVEFAMPVVIRALARLDAVATPRLTSQGELFRTDNGNPLLHAQFDPTDPQWRTPELLDQKIRNIPGTIETGLFLNKADTVLVANRDGTVRQLQHKVAP
ncbi:MAG: ribose-5-phosphate isomerase RpiA [Phycisphaerae bacterium]